MKSFRSLAGQRESRAFEEVLTEHLDALYRTALRFSHGRAADAEDLLQDALFRAFERFHELREPAAARAWMFTILTRTNLNRLRTRRRRPDAHMTDLDEHEFERALAEWQPLDGADAFGNSTELPDELTAALDALEEHLRQVVWLSDVEGFRQREVAEMLGVPEGTVASRLYRARRQLRESLRHALPSSVVRRA